MVDSTSRKDLLLSIPDKAIADNKKMHNTIQEGGALLALKETAGWKILYEEFLSPNININILLQAKPEELADIRAGVKKLTEMLNWMEAKIKSSIKLYEESHNATN